MADTELPVKFSECRLKIYSVTDQTIKEVYKTEAATTTVTMRPGTRPRTEYEYGNDMIARQMYSAKRSAAVYGNSTSESFLGVIQNRKSAQKAQDVFNCAVLRISPRGLITHLLPGTSPVFDWIGWLQLQLLPHTHHWVFVRVRQGSTSNTAHLAPFVFLCFLHVITVDTCLESRVTGHSSAMSVVIVDGQGFPS